MIMVADADSSLSKPSESRLRKVLPRNVSDEEIRAHLEFMPSEYFDRYCFEDIVHHIEVVNAFFTSLQGAHSDGYAPVIRCRQTGVKGTIEVTLCTWDRQGLFACIAGSLTCSNLNISHADVFTRTDHVVLDVFTVNDPDGRHVRNSLPLRKMSAFLEQSLNIEKPLDLKQVIEEEILPSTKKVTRKGKVDFDWCNRSDRNATRLTISMPDRQGLLFFMCRAFANLGLNVHAADIRTVRGRATDQFLLTDKMKRKITEPALKREIELALMECGEAVSA